MGTQLHLDDKPSIKAVDTNNFVLSQTALKDLERDETCPFRWQQQWILKNISISPNEAMLRGSYFEYLAIGRGSGASKEVTDLQRLKNGKKSVSQERIEEQAKICKRILFNKKDPDFLGFDVTDTQVELKIKNNRGVADIVAKKDGQICLIDLKLTRDITGIEPPYSYDHLDRMDLLQLIHYSSLYEKINNVRPEVFLLVFDYSPRKKIKLAKIEISESAILSAEYRFDTAREVIHMYTIRSKMWPIIPHVQECYKCPLRCSARLSRPKINISFETVNA